MRALAIAACLVPGLAQAKIAYAESIEWLVDSRPHIALAEVTRTREASTAPSERVERGPELRITEVRVTATLKGKPAARAELDQYHTPGTWPLPPGYELLVFFADDGTLDRAIDLRTDPWTVTHDFRVLKGREAILDAVRKRVANPGPRGAAVSVEVPFDSAADKALRMRSAVYLDVPPSAELKLEILARTRDPDPWSRARAAWQLASYPDAETKRVLRTLLEDPSESVIQQGSGDGQMRKRVVWPARQAAYDVLQSMGETVVRPKGYQPDLEARTFRTGSR